MDRRKVIEFFRRERAYRRFCEACLKKYESFGELRGSISLESYMEDEVRLLADFLGEADYKLLEKRRISLKAWIRQYEKTGFAFVPFGEVVREITKAELIKRTKAQLREQQREETYVQNLEKEYPNLFACLHSKEILHEVYMDSCKGKLGDRELEILERAVARLPLEDFVYLPLYVNQVAGHPHAFDSPSTLGRWFERLLNFKYEERLQGEDRANYERKSKAEQRHERLLNFGLLADDISNFVTVNALLAFQGEEGVGFWKQACESRLTWNVPLKHLVENSKFQPYRGRILFVVENSGLYSMLISKFPDLPAVCSHGQFKQAFWYLMEHLDGDSLVYYTGDFDPEGLRMADTLKKRYPSRIRLDFMTQDCYLLSSPKKELDYARLKKLGGTDSEELEGTVVKMKELRCAGYQEELFELYCAKIEEILKEEGARS